MNRKTIAAALFALSLVTVASAAQAQTYAWEENIKNSPVLTDVYTHNSDGGPIYQVTFDETFSK